MSGRVPVKGDRYAYPTKLNQAVVMVVMRVARDGTWADISCTDKSGAVWTKRQPLPVPGELTGRVS